MQDVLIDFQLKHNSEKVSYLKVANMEVRGISYLLQNNKNDFDPSIKLQFFAFETSADLRFFHY